jgi:hypothetical protein
MTTRFRALWILGVVLSVLAGIAAVVLEAAIKPGHPCVTGNPSHGLRYFVLFLVFAVVPGAVVGVVGWRSGRGGEDTVGPFLVTVLLSPSLVFIGLLAAWHGSGCIT